MPAISHDLPDWLAEQLRTGLAEWRKGTENGNDQLRQLGCAIQLRALREVAWQLTNDPNAAEPVAHLISALLGASQGAANPLLTPAHRDGGRPPADLLPQLHRARAAAALHLLIATGLSRDEAAAHVIATLNHAGACLFPGHGAAPRAELIRLRDRLTSRKGTPATNYYWKSLREVQDQPPEEGARWLLAGFERTADAAETF